MSFIYASNSIASVVLLFLILLIYFLECYVQIKFPQRKKPIKKGRVHLLFEADGVLLMDDKKKTEFLNSYFAFVLTVKGENI